MLDKPDITLDVYSWLDPIYTLNAMIDDSIYWVLTFGIAFNMF